MSSATVNPIAPRNIPAFAYHYDDAARHADAYLRGNDNTASNNSKQQQQRHQQQQLNLNLVPSLLPSYGRLRRRVAPQPREACRRCFKLLPSSYLPSLGETVGARSCHDDTRLLKSNAPHESTCRRVMILMRDR